MNYARWENEVGRSLQNATLLASGSHGAGMARRILTDCLRSKCETLNKRMLRKCELWKICPDVPPTY